MTQPADLVAASRAHGVRDPRLLEAIAAVPRAQFVPPDLAEHAYQDVPLPIPHGQVTTQPSLVTQMVEALELSSSDRVLEIGTGFGWQTAVLARLAGEVWSVERWEDIAHTARTHLERHGVDNATVVVGDGSAGSPSTRPTTQSSSQQRSRRFLHRWSSSSQTAAGSSSRSASAASTRSSSSRNEAACSSGGASSRARTSSGSMASTASRLEAS